MSRSGYVEDDDVLSMGRWRCRVASALRGKRGQSFLREALAALDAMPDKRLIAHDLAVDGEFCMLGVVGAGRNIDLTALDPEDYDRVADAFGIAPCMAQEIVFENDEQLAEFKWVRKPLCGPVRPWEPRYIECQVEVEDVAQKRWVHMRQWVAGHIETEAKA